MVAYSTVKPGVLYPSMCTPATTDFTKRGVQNDILGPFLIIQNYEKTIFTIVFSII